MKKKLLFQGTATALVTPFKRDGAVDEATLRDLVDFQLKNKVEALAPAGGMGEAGSLSESEQTLVLETVVEQAAKRVSVIGGVGGDSTLKAIALAKGAKSCGVHAILVSPPFSGSVTQEGLYRHYCSIADAVEFPIVIDNVSAPSRAALDASTAVRLAHDVPFIVGIVEAHPGDVMTILSERPAGFGVWSGSDMLALSLLALGADGALSDVSNEVPRGFSDLVRLGLKGANEKARVLHYRLLPLMNAHSVEPSPVPIKTALAMMGMLEENVRLPLVAMSEQLRPRLEAILAELDILPEGEIENRR
jgi:4-hydroxy-tetrahydrodipicolinate synthase